MRYPLFVEPEQLATIVAALRFWQESGCADPSHRSDELHEIATDNGDLTSLDERGIDALCEQLSVPPEAAHLDVDVTEWEGTEGYVVVYSDNNAVFCPTEDEACAYRRGHRRALGLDPLTGEYA